MHSGGRREGKEILNEAELPELSPISLSGLKRVTSCSVYMSVHRWSVTWNRQATSCFSHKLDLAELANVDQGDQLKDWDTTQFQPGLAPAKAPPISTSLLPAGFL